MARYKYKPIMKDLHDYIVHTYGTYRNAEKSMGVCGISQIVVGLRSINKVTIDKILAASGKKYAELFKEYE